MIVKDITDLFERIAPLAYQESYDNSGLIIGSPHAEVHKILLCLDCTEKVVDEAVSKGCDLIIAHHPVIFKGIKKINGSNDTERVIVKAIKENISIYAAHTNLDNVLRNGVNEKIAHKLGLGNLTVLQPKQGLLEKIVLYSPPEAVDVVKNALFEAGAGSIGLYSECSFEIKGKGSFKPGEHSDPYSGKIGQRENVEEMRIEAICPAYLSQKVIQAVKKVHPYEEMAYDILNTSNFKQDTGSGIFGTLNEEMQAGDFLAFVKKCLGAELIKFTEAPRNIKKVAICGGAGSFLLQSAIRSGADAFITGDVKYHDFFDAAGHLMYCDIGHFESEISTLELFDEVIRENFPSFAVVFCETNTNPVKYYK